ncbi:MAG: AAA family ATPase [Patescibacteria group bacterium]|nr:AAA family ATPase [Patescibacteria group bacterium]
MVKKRRPRVEIDDDESGEGELPKVSKNNKILSIDELRKLMKSPRDIELFLKILVYGRSGTGKTAFAGTLPKPILYLDMSDKGTDTLRDFGDEEIRIIPVRDWNDIESVYWFLQSGGHKEFPSVVLDTISGMQNRFGMPEVKVRDGRDATSPMTTPLWGDLSGLMREWLTAFRDLPMNVAFLAQDRTENVDGDTGSYDDEDLLPEVGPAVMPSVAKEVNAAVNVIGNTFIKKITKQKDGKIIRKSQFRMRLGPHPYYLTKIRKPPRIVVPGSIKNPNYDSVMAIIRGEAPDNGEE